MNFQQASNELKEIISKMNHYSVPEKLKSFLIELENQALLEIQTDGKALSKARIANKILNDKMTKSRPILSKAVIKNNFQDFTNSYILAHLSEDHMIEGLKHHDVNDYQYSAYPSFDTIINTHSSNIKMVATVNLLEAKIKKQKKELVKFASWDDEKGFDPELIIQALTLLEYKNGENVQIELTRDSGFIKKSESLVLVMSKRIDK